uniref:Putative secreted peptide n=1 Tax=Anopheles braziliensis TaxID=58242 RepID=A0A2M3ZSR1_9DIPT
MSILFVVWLCITASPKSAITHVPFARMRMFFVFRSRCAMAGLPSVPKISVCRCTNPLAIERQIVIIWCVVMAVRLRKSYSEPCGK